MFEHALLSYAPKRLDSTIGLAILGLGSSILLLGEILIKGQELNFFFIAVFLFCSLILYKKRKQLYPPIISIGVWSKKVDFVYSDLSKAKQEKDKLAKFNYLNREISLKFSEINNIKAVNDCLHITTRNEIFNLHCIDIFECKMRRGKIKEKGRDVSAKQIANKLNVIRSKALMPEMI